MGREICKFKTGSLWDVQADSARADILADSPSNDSRRPLIVFTMALASYLSLFIIENRKIPALAFLLLKFSKRNHNRQILH